jgi:hypothetical protein
LAPVFTAKNQVQILEINGYPGFANYSHPKLKNGLDNPIYVPYLDAELIFRTMFQKVFDPTLENPDWIEI